MTMVTVRIEYMRALFLMDFYPLSFLLQCNAMQAAAHTQRTTLPTLLLRSCCPCMHAFRSASSPDPRHMQCNAGWPPRHLLRRSTSIFHAERGFAFHCWDRGFLHDLQTTAAASARGAGDGPGGHAMHAACMKHDGWTTGHKFNCGFFFRCRDRINFFYCFYSFSFLFFLFVRGKPHHVSSVRSLSAATDYLSSQHSTAPYRTITT